MLIVVLRPIIRWKMLIESATLSMPDANNNNNLVTLQHGNQDTWDVQHVRTTVQNGTQNYNKIVCVQNTDIIVYCTVK